MSLANLRYAFRSLARAPGFTLVSIATLAIGIGATTAIFAAVSAFFLRPLPYPEGDRIVELREWFDREWTGSVSEKNFAAWKAQSRTLDDLVAYIPASFNVAAGSPERVRGNRVTDGYFRLFRASPALGRVFTADDVASRVVVLSHGLWQRRYGGDPDIIGRGIDLGGARHTVVGVMGAGLPTGAELWAPLALEGEKDGHYLQVLARLRPDTTIEAARGDMEAIAARLEELYPDHNAKRSVQIRPLHEVMVAEFRPGATILSLAVAFLLLIGCANIATLQLARAAGRRGEIAVRSALGAGRLRLVRQLFTESLLLALLGGVLGVLVAVWCMDLLQAGMPDSAQRRFPFHLDWGVAWFALAASLVSACLFGLVPALQSSRADLTDALRDTAARSTASRGRLKKGLVVAEIALSAALLVVCALLVRSMHRLQSAPLGFDPDSVLTLNISLPDQRYPDDAARVRFHQQVLDRVQALPGVRSAAVVNHLPLSRSNINSGFEVVGRPAPPPGEEPIAEWIAASPDYLRTMGLRLTGGRNFTDSDRAGSPPVILVNEALVRQHLGGRNPLGTRLDFGDDETYEVVGVVSDARRRSQLTDEPVAEAYFPAWQRVFETMSLAVRTDGDPAALAGPVRSAVAAVDPGQAVFEVRTMNDIVAEARESRRFVTGLFAAFAGVALLLASLGIYGVMAYHTGQRRQEMGIRMALGAGAGELQRMVVREGMSLVVLGLAFGLGGGALLSRLLRSLLYQVAAGDPSSYALAAIALGAVALVACWIPARRASRVDPVEALRAS